MTYTLTATRDVSAPATWLAGYRLSLAESDAAVTGYLGQTGPVENNVIHLRGVFATREEALRAALDYVGGPCKILSVRPWGEGIERLVVQAHSARADFPCADVAVAASRSARGVFVAA